MWNVTLSQYCSFSHLDVDLFVHFRLHSHGCSPPGLCMSLGEPRGPNPHSHGHAMTEICRNQALQLLVKRKDSGSKTTRGWQQVSPAALHPTLLCLLSTKALFVRKVLFLYLSEGVAERNCSFQKSHLWKWKYAVTRLRSLWSFFFSFFLSLRCFLSNWYSHMVFTLEAPVLCDAQ